MTARNEDLHGNAPDKADVALLLIVINDLEFPEGEQLFQHALPMAQHIAALKQRARRAGIPVVNGTGLQGPGPGSMSSYFTGRCPQGIGMVGRLR